jgi:NAD(P)-dependent dehydrogenase (short-subunit alcohol dehydrogenase family)
MTIALITGGNRGLGFETARRLARSGATTLIGARDGAQGQLAARVLCDEGLDARSITIDVTSVASVSAAVEEVADRHGGLDVLVNNAGVLPEATCPTADPIDLEMFTRTFATNVFGAVTAIQGFLPLLRASATGRIVNVSSRMGSLADQSDPTSPYYATVVPAYQASKAALNGITVALAKALTGTTVKVNSVCPGWVQTDLGGPANRALAPLTADEASAVVAAWALLPADGPTGAFIDAHGTVAW